MSRSPERLGALLLVSALVLAPSAALADPVDTAATVEDLLFPVEDIVGEVESMDGAESESQQGEEVTVGLTSDVLFALDRAVLTPQAKVRLRRVAAKVRAESAGGEVRIEGHTDDQGADAYNDRLSLKRAQAVQQALQGLLADAGVTLRSSGYGEAKPKLPNVVEGKPIEANRAKNRRVEIVFTAKQ